MTPEYTQIFIYVHVMPIRRQTQETASLYISTPPDEATRVLWHDALPDSHLISLSKEVSIVIKYNAKAWAENGILWSNPLALAYQAIADDPILHIGGKGVADLSWYAHLLLEQLQNISYLPLVATKPVVFMSDNNDDDDDDADEYYRTDPAVYDLPY